ncbi:MAG: EAL domain-containing protein [Cyanobacteria bacterium J06621_11]
MKTGIDALLIEDNPSDALLFEALISSSEFNQLKLHHTERFNDALNALQENTFDVILLDLCLPDGRGIDLVKQLKERMPQVPIVVMTGIQDESMAVAALKEGAQDYLVKSDTFSPQRLEKLGYVDIGNLLVKTLRYAIERAELTQQLEISQERYSLAVEGARDGIWDWDLRANRVYYSPRWQALIGFPHEGRSNDSPQKWLSRIHPDDQAEFHRQLNAHLSHPKQQQFHHEYRLLHADGNYRWVLTRGMALWDEDGIAYRLAGSQTDMTARKALENALYQEKELAQITLHSIGDAVITTDEQGYIKDFNPVAERLTGWPAKEARHRPISEVCTIVDGATRENLNNPVMQAIQEGEAISLSNHPTLISKTGEEFAIGDSAAPIRSSQGDIVGTVLVFHDVTEERGRAKQLAWQASHDPLTHLLNRQKFMQSLTEVIDEAHERKTHHVLCCMDLDHFKAVNDTCGHAAGDKLLRQVADLWRTKIRGSDSLARLGGDEFGLLLYDCELERAIDIANSFCESIQAFRFAYEDKVFSIGVSIGLVSISDHSIGTEHVLQLADSACYSAKNKGRNRVQVYYQNDDEINQLSRESQWFSRITQALDNDQFVLYEQAIANTQADSEQIELCEVLLRLKDDNNQEMIPPMAFIPPAERYNLMPKIDRWVIKTFLAHLEQQPKPLTKLYSINLSGSSINDESFIDFLKEQLTLHRVDTRSLCFEITETVAISNLQKAVAFILELKKLGCSFALDDFGSGMSSFTYLKHLPVDFLKIDGNFVKDSATDTIICAMLEAINQVGHVMGLKTIAEYVETQPILAKVRELGIDYVQGYEIQRPQQIQIGG